MYQTKLNNFTINYTNQQEYHILKQEIFTQNSYYIELKPAAPVIIDAGAHIGLATLYFKSLYPDTKIIAIEPNPRTFEILQQNIEQNGLTDVELHNVALAPEEGKATFYFDSSEDQWLSTAGFIKGAWDKTQKSQSVEVSTRTLSSFIKEPIDLLKLDIEGAEQQVLRASADKLDLVKNMFIEVHPHNSGNCTKLTRFLKKHGFILSFDQDGRDVLEPDQDKLFIIGAKNGII